MGEILFAGVSHHPGFSYPDEHMADILRMHLKSDRVPSSAKDPATWPALMATEFGVDGANATATATQHRAKVMGGLPAGAPAYRCIQAGRDCHLGRRPVREFPGRSGTAILRVRPRPVRVHSARKAPRLDAGKPG